MGRHDPPGGDRHLRVCRADPQWIYPLGQRTKRRRRIGRKKDHRWMGRAEQRSPRGNRQRFSGRRTPLSHQARLLYLERERGFHRTALENTPTGFSKRFQNAISRPIGLTNPSLSMSRSLPMIAVSATNVARWSQKHGSKRSPPDLWSLQTMSWAISTSSPKRRQTSRIA